MVDKFKPEIEKLLSGSGLKVDQVVDLIFSFDKNKDKKISPEEIASGIKNRVKTLGWTTDKEALSRDQILEKLTNDYPKASAIAKEGLVNQLMVFDQELVEGNADGKLDARELAIPGLAMGVIETTDFSDGFKIPENSLAATDSPEFDKKLPRLVEDQVNLKFKQQLVGRYVSIDPKNLSSIDAKLEWMQLALKLMASNRAVENMNWYNEDGGAINRAQVKNLLGALGYSNVVDAKQFNFLALAYDFPIVGGHQDKKYDSIEIFQLLTDADFAMKMKETKLYQNKEAMALLYPKISPELFNDSVVARLNDLASKDIADFALELSFVKLTETVFKYYDTDQNLLLKKDNLYRLLLEADPKDAQKKYINAFFADAIPGDCTKKVNVTKTFFEVFRAKNELSPSETLPRIRNIVSYALLCIPSTEPGVTPENTDLAARSAELPSSTSQAPAPAAVTEAPSTSPVPMTMKELKKKQREERRALRNH